LISLTLGTGSRPSHRGHEQYQFAAADRPRDTRFLRAWRSLPREPAAELGRSGATRGRRWDCDNVMSPTVLPVVSYRDVRRWQRRGAKLPRQRILTLRSGRESVSRHGDCQHRGGRDPGGGGTVNPGEASLNVVTKDKPKVLTGLGQKARGQVWRLRTPPAQMLHHRRRDAT